MERAFRGGSWHGPAVLDVLGHIDAERAGERPIPEAHTIAELVLHMAVWKDAARRRISGEDYSPPCSADWRPLDRPLEAEWRAALAELVATHDALRAAVASLDDAALERVVPGQTTTVYATLHGVIQHDLYHAGQIALLAKG